MIQMEYNPHKMNIKSLYNNLMNPIRLGGIKNVLSIIFGNYIHPHTYIIYHMIQKSLMQNHRRNFYEKEP